MFSRNVEWNSEYYIFSQSDTGQSHSRVVPAVSQMSAVENKQFCGCDSSKNYKEPRVKKPFIAQLR